MRVAAARGQRNACSLWVASCQHLRVIVIIMELQEPAARTAWGVCGLFRSKHATDGKQQHSLGSGSRLGRLPAFLGRAGEGVRDRMRIRRYPCLQRLVGNLGLVHMEPPVQSWPLPRRSQAPSVIPAPRQLCGPFCDLSCLAPGLPVTQFLPNAGLDPCAGCGGGSLIGACTLSWTQAPQGLCAPRPVPAHTSLFHSGLGPSPFVSQPPAPARISSFSHIPCRLV